MHSFELISHSPEQTEAIGHQIGNLLRQKPLPCVVLLYGGLGVGKTTLVKGIASAIGIDSREVGSASFVIAAEYEGEIPLCHIDLYRISDSIEVEDMGLWDYLSKEAIIVVEWADKIRDLVDAYLEIAITEGTDNTRRLTIENANQEDRDYLQAS